MTPVVIDVGVGESFESWSTVVAELSKTTSVFVYDRAGYGRSGMGPLPRDAASEAADLHALLRKADIQGPYVLVGHSLGGLNMQVLAVTSFGKLPTVVLASGRPNPMFGAGFR